MPWPFPTCLWGRCWSAASAVAASAFQCSQSSIYSTYSTNSTSIFSPGQKSKACEGWNLRPLAAGLGPAPTVQLIEDRLTEVYLHQSLVQQNRLSSKIQCMKSVSEDSEDYFMCSQSLSSQVSRSHRAWSESGASSPYCPELLVRLLPEMIPKPLLLETTMPVRKC